MFLFFQRPTCRCLAGEVFTDTDWKDKMVKMKNATVEVDERMPMSWLEPISYVCEEFFILGLIFVRRQNCN